MHPLYSQFLIPPYGAPDESSEVNRIPGFYSVASLTVFGPAPAQDQPTGLAEGLARLGAAAAAAAAAEIREVAEGILPKSGSAPTPA